MADFLFRSCRMSATQCLKHEWLNNLPAKAKKFKLRLKSQLLLQSYMAHKKWKVNRQTLVNLLPEGKSAQHRQSHSLLFFFFVWWLAAVHRLLSCKYEFGKYIFTGKLRVFLLHSYTDSSFSKFGFNFYSLSEFYTFFLYKFRDFRYYLALNVLHLILETFFH